MNNWPAPTTTSAVHARVAVPGSKSQTNRALVLAAVAAAQGNGTSTIEGTLRSRDTDLMVGALRTLGLAVEGDGTDVEVSGRLTPDARATIDCGLAGTVLRFVPAVAALANGVVTFDGDEQARVRPIAPLLDALRGLGVDIDGTGLPFALRATGSVRGGVVEIDASASSQFVSGLLLSGAAFQTGLTVVHTGESVPSAPHITMTTTMLREAGVVVDDSAPSVWEVKPGTVSARHWTVEPDLSNAVPFLAAGVVTGGTIRLQGWPRNSIQPAGHILEILRKLDCSVVQNNSYLEVQGPPEYGGIDVHLGDVGELTPAVAAIAALATEGAVSHLRGIAHLRGHETDRLAALRTEITRLGGRCEETADGLVITATPLRPATWHSYADHRMAMAGAIVGLRVPGVTVEDIATTSKTLPEFPRLWGQMLAQDRGA